jgi:hypothetical protein
MKTTVDIPDSIYRQLKARAALRGQTVKAFLLDAIKDKLASRASNQKGPSGWRSVFGRATQMDVEELQPIIDVEFSRINPD